MKQTENTAQLTTTQPAMLLIIPSSTGQHKRPKVVKMESKDGLLPQKLRKVARKPLKQATTKHFSSPHHKKTFTSSTVRPFKCGVCSKCFTQRRILNEHMAVHMATRPYPCTICNKGFNWRGNLNKHYKAHHPLTSSVHDNL